MAVVDPTSLEYEGIHVTNNDFVGGSEDSSDLNSGELGEIAVAEVGEDGQFSAYDAVRLGDEMDPTGNSPKGKLYVDLQGDQDGDGTVEQVPDDTQLRWIARDKNSNRREPLTRWYAHRDLDQSRPDLRTPLPPVTRNGNPWFVKDGRIIALEAKRESGSLNVSLADSTFEVPSRGGY